MNAIFKSLVTYLCKFLPIRQLVASLLAKALNAVLVKKDAASIADYINTADCVFEAAAAMQIVAQKLGESIKDGTVSNVEADEIVQAIQDAFSKWANGDHTPQAFKDKLRVMSVLAEPATPVAEPAVQSGT